jgi:hypothetical protein
MCFCAYNYATPTGVAYLLPLLAFDSLFPRRHRLLAATAAAPSLLRLLAEVCVAVKSASLLVSRFLV